jgi:hypothetical protein
MQQPRENFWDKDGHFTKGTRISVTPAIFSFHSKPLTTNNNTRVSLSTLRTKIYFVIFVWYLLIWNTHASFLNDKIMHDNNIMVICHMF